MTVTVFTTMLMIVSTLTSLTTEAIKKATETKQPNLVALVTSAVISILVSLTYCIMTGAELTPQFIVTCVWLLLLSALTSMCGYDKVIGIIKQWGAK